MALGWVKATRADDLANIHFDTVANARARVDVVRRARGGVRLGVRQTHYENHESSVLEKHGVRRSACLREWRLQERSTEVWCCPYVRSAMRVSQMCSS